MITKALVKDEIDKVPSEHLPILYRIIQALEGPVEAMRGVRAKKASPPQEDWHRFITETYGSFADAPIERGPQGRYEEREEFT